ncbi:P-loop containing nucleoside triphosphate hydrolase protein [Polychaeton citri CBS 116435]|uniref:P-loop containing nucleoside triphosphate hydrolase protein n=1 Tax=Polychaeton citri CBS 116435 TaxID=1314669 RepID=A0A9P4ULN4_9PEZI|nr:P-loop containing nucleoside triphosphate hydrolase protein [Polychaeton citri CBS 116435]
MDFSRLVRAMPSTAVNGTDDVSFTQLQPNILDALIPGYSLISKYIIATTGVDISMFVTALAICFGTIKGGQYLLTQFERGFRKLVMSSVYVNDTDDLFDQVMDWLDHRGNLLSKRSARAKTLKGSNWDDASNTTVSDAIGDDGMFDYNKWAARTPPRFEPWYGRNFVWHEGSLFLLRRLKREGNRMQISWNNRGDEDQLQIDCIGFSIQPIQGLLRTIKVWSLGRQRNTTTIRHPTPKDHGRGSGTWSKTSSRPSRPMETVILDATQKNTIIKDMNEYLHPLSPKWYANRGIPYRRGYLFYGPPGTGKTSLSFALGGIFGLDIYVISLQEPTLTEGDLMQLFNSLPKRCIVLLEDVDAAGLVKRDDGSGKTTSRKIENPTTSTEAGSTSAKTQANAENKSESEDVGSVSDMLKVVVRELRKSAPISQRGDRSANAQNGKKVDNTISLSGLLNAIDGVATHEGRVLIMTTNHPEELDPALVRPGRVDRRIEFKLAMKEQIRELFVRMYGADDQQLKFGNDTMPKIEQNGHLSNGTLSKPARKEAPIDRNANGSDNDELSTMTKTEVRELAVTFAAQFSDHEYTPAEIQNLLMRYKKQPKTAVEKVDEWRQEVAEEKLKQQRAREDKEDSLGRDS